MLSTLLLAVLVAAPHVASPSLDLSGGARVSNYSGALDWSRSWASDWGAAIAGMPSPTIACEADADSFDCVGATVTAVGSPPFATAPGYPEQWTADLDGSTDYFDLGTTTASPAGDFTVCTVMRPDATGKSIVGRDGSTSNRQWLLYDGAAYAISLYVMKSDASSTSLTLGNGASGTWSTVCAVYDWVSDGASIMRGNFNGTAPSEKTNAVGPPQALSGVPLRIGADSAAGAAYKFDGGIGLFLFWDGTAATAAQLATMVAAMQARATAKPNALVTVSSGATKAWGASGTVYSLPANSLAPSATGAGMEIWSAAQHSNALPTSTTAGWTGSAAAVANAAGPDGSATSASTITGDGADSEHYVAQDYTGTAVAWVDSVYLKVEAGWAFVSPDGGTSGIYVNRATCAAGTATTLTSSSVALAPGNAYCRVQMVKTLTAATYAMRIYIAEADGDRSFSAAGTETLTFYAPAAQIGNAAGPPTPSAGTPVVGAIDQWSVANTVGAVGGASMCVGVIYTKSVWNGKGLFELGSFAGANTAAFHISGVGAFYGYYAGPSNESTTLTTATGQTFSAGSKLVACLAGGSGRMWIDGVEKTVTAGGTPHSGWGTAPATVKHHSQYAANGYLKRVCQGKTYAAVRKCLDAP